jgi:hypothetical protein
MQSSTDVIAAIGVGEGTCKGEVRLVRLSRAPLALGVCLAALASAALPTAVQAAGGLVFQSLADPITQTFGSNVTATGPGENAVTAQSQGGAVSLTVSPSVTVESQGAGAIGIRAESAAGPVLVTVNGTVRSSNAAGGNAIQVGSFTAPVSVVAGAGSLIRADGATASAIVAESGAAVSVVSRGTVQATGTSSVAINAFSAASSVTVETNILSASGFGIVAATGAGGAVSVTTNGASTAAGRGIQAYSQGAGTGNVTIAQLGGLTVSGLTGITGVGLLGQIDSLDHTGTLAITSAGPLSVTSASGLPVQGISATNLGRGNTSIQVSGNITLTTPTLQSATGIGSQTTFGAVSITQAATSLITLSGGSGTGASGPAGILVDAIAGPVTIASAGGLNLTNTGNQASAAISVRTLASPVSITQTGTITIRGANTFGIGVQFGALPPFAQAFAALIPPLPATPNPNTTIVARNVSALDGIGIGVAGGTAQVTIQSGGTISGGLAAIAFQGTGAVRIDNSGTLRALSTVAVDASASAGALTLVNASGGTIVGGVRGSALVDTFTNSAGATFALEGLPSDAGAGNDTLVNDGLITLAAAGAPAQAGFLGLETLRNGATGQISLQGRGAGDVLTFSGPAAYVGSGGSLAVDASLGLAGVSSDRLVIGGAASGTTRVRIADTAANSWGSYDPVGAIVVQAGSAAAGAFALETGPIRKGLFSYDLAANGDRTQWRLISRPTLEAVELGSFVAGVHQVAATTGSQFAAHSHDSPGWWGSASWSRLSRDDVSTFTDAVGGATTTFNASYDLNRASITLGYGWSFPLAGEASWQINAGLTGVQGEQDFSASGNLTRMKGVMLGVSAGYRSGGLRASLTLHGSDLDNTLRQTTVLAGAPVGVEADLSSATVGLTATAAWRRDLSDGWYIEPGVSMGAATTSVDDVILYATPVAFSDAETREATLELAAGRSFETSAARHRVSGSLGISGQSGDGNATAILSGPGLVIADPADDSWGTARIGWQRQAKSGSAVVDAAIEHSFGADVVASGTSVRVGVRLGL